MKAFLGRNKHARVQNGHPWIFKNEIERTEGELLPGNIIDVFTFNKTFIGRGYINPKSQITIRLLTRNADEQINKEFFRQRLHTCKDYRSKINYTGNYRLVFGEADFLPALVIDKFGDNYVLQTLSAGMDKWKHDIANILINDFNANGVYERNDAPVRKLEGLEETSGFLSKQFPTKFIADEYGVKFEIDIAKGQKTGFFLDQKENRLALKHIVKGGEVLDCFTYTGSFALFAAHFGAKNVLGLDISDAAVEQAQINASLNGFNNCSFIAVNAFDVLPQWVREQKKYDVVILDPPAFTKNRQGVANALKGYKEINLRAMKIIKPGGFLVTFSCSHFILAQLFYKVISEAAADAGKNSQRNTIPVAGKRSSCAVGS
jgi:23S rRNA (cytosine1962-C5)-methyltransferase